MVAWFSSWAGCTREVDDGREPGGQRRGSGQHLSQRAGLPGQDDDQLVVPAVLMLVGHRLVQAPQRVPAAAGQGVPGVRAGDHQQVPGEPDRLGYLDRGVPQGSAGQVRGVDLGQLAVRQQAELLVQAIGSGASICASAS
jgi:hypothetical protein